MAVCRHCGAIFDDELKECPDCGQKNTDVVDESYLDSLLNSLVDAEPQRPVRKAAPSAEKVSEAPKSDFISKEEHQDESFFTPDEDLELEEYNIFDELEHSDVDALISAELGEEAPSDIGFGDMDFPEDNGMPEFDFSDLGYSEDDTAESAALDTEEPDLFSADADFPMEDYFGAEPVEDMGMPDFFGGEEDMSGIPEIPDETPEEAAQQDVFALDDSEFAGLDELLQNFDEDSLEDITPGDGYSDPGLEELLASEIEATQTAEAADGPKGKSKKTKEKKKDDRSFWQRIFGNVPVDPSKKKPEPTPEEIAAAKEKKAAEKKQSDEEKKKVAAEKKEAAKKAKEEKARQAEIAKEQKKAKKMEEAKKILEEMQETRINRVGATVIFVFFALLVVIVLLGSNLFTYSISMKNAEKYFEKARGRNVKYYTEAYNHIYGLEMRNQDDAELQDKILTVMFVNKELNSYNSYMALGDYESALHSLIKGLFRYGYYVTYGTKEYQLDVKEDLDYVQEHIMRELKSTFGVSKVKAAELSAMLNPDDLTDEIAVQYSMELYRIVSEMETEETN